MQYKLSSAEENEYVDCSATENIDLEAGTYKVRYKAKEGYYDAGIITEVVVEEGAKSTDATLNSVLAQIL